jgi:hypothetical protein
VVTQHGFTIAEKQNSSRTKAIKAIVALRSIYAKGGVQGLHDVLYVIEQCWPTQSFALSAGILLGIYTVLAKYPKVDRKLLAKKLAGTSLDGVRQMAQSFVPSFTGKQTRHMPFTAALAATYNRHRHGAHRLDLSVLYGEAEETKEDVAAQLKRAKR